MNAHFINTFSRAVVLAIMLFTLMGMTSVAGCALDSDAPDDPIRFAFVPSVEAGAIELELEDFDNRLSELIGHPVESDIVLNYTACIEQMEAGHFDAAMLPVFAYVLAHDRYGVKVVLKAVRDGKATYRGEFITRTDSGIDSIEDLKDRTFAFTDPASASGHLYPKTFLISNGINPESDLAEYSFKGGHTAVVISVMSGTVDAGACFEGARDLVLDTYPSILEETKVIGNTPVIPGDTVSFRSGLEGPFYDRLVAALIELSEEEDSPLFNIYSIESLVPAVDSDYDPIREMVKMLEYDLESSVD